MRELMLLAEIGLRALILGVLAVLATWLIRHRGAELQHAVWRTVLVAMLALPILMILLPPLVIPLSSSAGGPVSTALSAIHPTATNLEMPPSSFSTRPATARSVSAPPQWPSFWIGLYAALVMLFLSRIALAVWRARKVASSGRRVTKELLYRLEYPVPEVLESSVVRFHSR
jgi:hypothetical protein